MLSGDDEFIRQFEDHTLPDAEFTHRGHLRLAWVYLQRYTLDEAIRKTTSGIKSYAASLGATDKFHFTVTEAIVRIMHQRLTDSRADDFSDYLAKNNDLLDDLLGLLSQHYSDTRLWTENAKLVFLDPDRKPFD